MKLPLEEILANRNNLLVEFKRNIDVKYDTYQSLVITAAQPENLKR